MHQASEFLADDYRTAFVLWLTTRTLEGCVRWEKHPNGFIGHLNGSVFAQFITHCSPHGQAWRFFTVRDSNIELLRATSSAKGVETASVAVAIQVLFCTIMWAGSQLIH